MDRKKRILWCSEGSMSLSTGFSGISYEILNRLHATGKYELFEIASYVRVDDPKLESVPWKAIGTIPADGDEEGHNRYRSDPTAQFGSSIFEQALLEFKPDIVHDNRDNWMGAAWQLKSPFRKYFKYLYLSTIDGKPQRAEWTDDHKNTDLLLTYSQFAKDLVEETSGNTTKVFDVVRPGVNPDIFKPLNKTELRKQFGLPENANIILTVMRNQRRKLFPDLIEMFAEFLRECVKNNKEDLAKNTYLYLHTSYPDVGFDISRHILDNGVGHKVYVTYLCNKCNGFFPDFFQTEYTTCKHCGAVAAHMPNSQYSLRKEDLPIIYNFADVYIQYSICEGWGVPVTEAKACGLTAMGIDYSATSEQVNVYGCYPLKVGKFFHEAVVETEQIRALPDNKDTIEKLFEYFSLSKEEKKKMSLACIKDATENCSFERAAKIFEKAIDSIEVSDHNLTWDNPKSNLIQVNPQINQNWTNGQLVDYCIAEIIKKPQLLDSHWRNSLIKGLNVGYTILHGGRQNFDKNVLINMFVSMVNVQNEWEMVRVNKLKFDKNKNDIKTIRYETI